MSEFFVGIALCKRLRRAVLRGPRKLDYSLSRRPGIFVPTSSNGLPPFNMTALLAQAAACFTI